MVLKRTNMSAVSRATSQERCLPRQAFSNDLAHTLAPGVLDVRQPSGYIARKLYGRPLEDVHRSPGDGEERSARWWRILVVSFRCQLDHQTTRRQDLPSLLHRTFRSFSRLISYSAYLKKSSFLTPCRMREVSRCVRRRVIWSISSWTSAEALTSYCQRRSSPWRTSLFRADP